MQSGELANGARTVTQIAAFFDELKAAALDLASRFAQSTRVHYTPVEENEIRALLVSYWQSRSALLELIMSVRSDRELTDADRRRAFLVAFSSALVLVDAARFIREHFNDRNLLRDKWNEPAIEFGIPAGTFDAVQRSLLSARHAWHLYHAHLYWEKHQSELRNLADAEFANVLALIDRLYARIDVSIAQFARTRLRVRSGQLVRGIRQHILVRAMYGIQKLVAASMADVYVRAGHQPGLPPEIAAELPHIIAPGDILVVRKEYAITNYFLPGFWPHAALYLGDAEALVRLGLSDHEFVQPRWDHFRPTPMGDARRVLESMADGVQIRSLNSPLASDSVVVLRPQLNQSEIAEGLARGIAHEGKPYDFAFDFTRSDRLVCTEVVYRAYDGLGQVRFPLRRRVGRLTLSGEDLIQLAIQRTHFDAVAIFAPGHHPRVLLRNEAHQAMVQIHQTHTHGRRIDDESS